LTEPCRTFIIGGYDTTANALSWLFWELAKDQRSQQHLRDEISAARAKKIGDAAFSINEYDNMPYLNAVIKENLRLHAGVPNLWRMAGRDDMIPLAEPITTNDGRVLHEIPVAKGQPVICACAAYNRLPGVWGNDADCWRPERWLNMEKHEVSVGMTANLMTFSAGLKGCIGWRFS
jgi:alkylphenol/PAH-inducible cytochrome P450 monooxygenase